MPQEQVTEVPPRTVISAKRVELALIEYKDNDGVDKTQLAVVGDHTCVLVDGRPFGLSTKAEHIGVGSKWLRDGVFTILGKALPKEE
jgi:hypothetical protein